MRVRYTAVLKHNAYNIITEYMTCFTKYIFNNVLKHFEVVYMYNMMYYHYSCVCVCVMYTNDI